MWLMLKYLNFVKFFWLLNIVICVLIVGLIVFGFILFMIFVIFKLFMNGSFGVF